jgi:hypothetical protein
MLMLPTTHEGACQSSQSVSQSDRQEGRGPPGERRRTWQLLKRDVVHDLVVAALQEGGVDGAEGRQALAGQPRSEAHGVLLRDAHVKRSRREALRQDRQSLGRAVQTDRQTDRQTGRMRSARGAAS